MRAVITEVNTQFKDPVRLYTAKVPSARTLANYPLMTGKDNFRLRVHFRVSLPLRNRTAGARAHVVRDRHAQHRRQPAALSQAMYVFLDTSHISLFSINPLIFSPHSVPLRALQR